MSKGYLPRGENYETPKGTPLEVGSRVGRTLDYVRGLEAWHMEGYADCDIVGEVTHLLPTGYVRVLWDGAENPEVTSPRILEVLS